MRNRAVWIAVTCVLFSCGTKEKLPAGVLPQDKMQAVFWDVIKAEVFTNEFIKKDSARNAVAENEKLQQQVFAMHKVSREDFYKSYDYYKAHSVAFKKIMDSMVVKAERDHYNKPKTTAPLTLEQ